MKVNKLISVIALCCTLALTATTTALASGEGAHHHEHGKATSNEHAAHGKAKGQHKGHKMGESTREVLGHGRINKIMADRGMININHEAMPEMQWPKMRMNFKTAEGVDLSGLKLGQMVKFKLLVDEKNNYVIKEITGLE